MAIVMGKKWLRFVCLSLAITASMWVLTMNEAAAKSAFPSKTITYVVPTSPGGGFDTFSRMIIPYLRKYLPGNPNIIIKNAPGGEWKIGINKMYRAKPDGHTIAVLNMPANALPQVLGEAKYDLKKATWLGNIGGVTYVTAISLKSKYKSMEALKKAPMVTSGTVGLASTAGLGTVLAAERMGIKMKYIPHSGSTEAILAGIRGDVDWVQYPFSTLKKSIVDSQDLIPDVPTIAELGYPDLVNVVKMLRPVAAPPGLPDNIRQTWQDAFWKATNDPEFQKKQIAANASPQPMRPQELEDMVEAAIKLLEQYKEVILKHRK